MALELASGRQTVPGRSLVRALRPQDTQIQAGTPDNMDVPRILAVQKRTRRHSACTTRRQEVELSIVYLHTQPV